MEKIMENVMKGTTTMGLVCKDGVVLASEKRATMGYFVASKTAKKIYQINGTVGMTTAGIVGDAQSLVRLISVEARLYQIKREEPMTVRAMSTLLSNILSSQRFFPYIVQLLMGGVDRNGPHIFSVDPFGGYTEEKEIAATGSGAPIAYGVLEDRYSKELMPDKAAELAIQAMHSAMKRDTASGEEMEVVVITKDKYEELSEEKVKEIKSSL